MPEKVVEGNRKSRRPRRDSRPRLSGRSQLDIRNRYPRQKISVNFDARLRLFIYRHLIAKCRAPSIAEMARVPTAFPVRIGNRSYYGNCIWDALGIPAMLHKDAQIDASCGCCNLEMLLKVENGRLLGPEGLIHIAVPARDWYKDIVFT